MIGGERMTRTLRHHLADEPAIGIRIGNGSSAIKFRIVEKLSGSPCHDEAMMGVVRRWGLANMASFSRDRVEVVAPNQFVGVSEGVLKKNEGTVLSVRMG